MAGEDPAEQAQDALDAVRAALEADARSWAAQVEATAGLVAASRSSTAVSGERSFVELEIAGSWAVGQATATRLMVEAEHLTGCLPQTLAALSDGRLLVHQGRVLLHVTRHCDPGIARRVEAEVLASGGADLCPADLRATATAVLLRLESEAAAQDPDQDLGAQRHADAAASRHTWAKPDTDGMGIAGAVLTAEQLRSWSCGMDTLERQERLTDRAAGIERTADQRRADLFAALPAMLLSARAELEAWAGRGAAVSSTAGAAGAAAGAPGAPSGAPGAPAGAPVSSADVTPHVVLNVHVPVATVLGLSREPGHLDGYGPISAEHVRLLRPRAFRRVMVDARSGRPIAVDDRAVAADPDPPVARQQVLDMLRPDVVVDRAEPQHDPSARLARLVDVRDRRCSGPGCSCTRTHRDHLVPHPLGPTAAWNLGRLSDRCHQAKHAGWTLQRHDDGRVTWLSPLGRTYRRPSPHRPPPQVDLYGDLPPLRPPPAPSPTAGELRAASEPEDLLGRAAPAGPAPEDSDDTAARPVLPDDPPF